MKLLSRIIIIFCLFLANYANAEPFKVLVLPTDLFSVCANYYCFPEVSEIFAEDIIANFNGSGKISSPNLYDVRKKLTENPQLKNFVAIALNKYKNSDNIDFNTLKTISNNFDTNSILLISSDVGKRSIWEVLEISSAFGAVNQYTLETKAVLTDNVNDVVMWSGKYQRILGDSESRFWAKSSAQANSQLEKLRFYSRNIISKNITQNIILRFYPKVPKTITPKATTQPKKEDFRPNPLGSINTKADEEYGDIESETIFDF